jgi:hypothetical protein
MVPSIIVVLFLDFWRKIKSELLGRYFVVLVIVSAVIFTIAMRQFNPNDINIGRVLAVNDWLDNLFHGIYPYEAGSKPSGMPFLFILFLPFYLMGDAGLMQIFTFIILAVLIYKKNQEHRIDSFRLLLLYMVSPVFLFEVLVRGDLGSNVILAIAFLEILRRYKNRGSIAGMIVFGLCGGLILSTRGVVFIIYVIFFCFYLRQLKLTNAATFIISLGAGFILSLLPFVIWNQNLFFQEGPFAIQLSYIPTTTLGIAIVLSVFLGFISKNYKDTYYYSSIMLFMIIFISFLGKVFSYGFYETLSNEYFDTAYFAFVLPLLIISMDLDISRKKGQGLLA